MIKRGYYPFGLKHKGYNDVVSANVNSVASKYDYQGKENQEELGLNWHDFGARNYDASLGRWMNIDPLSEEFYSYSPYNAMMNNPIGYIDPDGRSADWINNGDGTWTAEKGDSAWTLAEDANISFEKAQEILANTPKDNPQGNMGTYEDTDGVVKSAVDEGDTVRVTGKEEGGFIVIPNDSDIVETDTSNMDFGETQITRTVKDPDALITTVQLLRVFVKEVDPTSSNLLNLSKRSKQVSTTRTTREAPSNTSTTNGTREVNVKGHWRTLQNGEKVWVKPHTRTITDNKTKSN